MKRHFIITFSIISTLLLSGVQLRASEPELSMSTSSLLDLLDREVGNKAEYEARRFMRADSIVRLLDTMPDNNEASLLLRGELGCQLSGVDVDSALNVFRRGTQLAIEYGDSSLVQRFLINTAVELQSLGLDAESLGLLNHIRRTGVKDVNRSSLSQAACRINMAIYNNYLGSSNGESYLARAVAFAREQLNLTPEDSPLYKFSQAIIYSHEDKRSLLVATLNDIVETTPMTDRIFSSAARMLGHYYYNNGRLDDAIHFFTLGSLSDLRRADNHGTSIIMLSRALYDKGEISRAYDYLTGALDSALKANTKANLMLISEALKPVSEDFRRQEERRFVLVSVLLGVLLVTLLFIIRILVSLRRDMKSLKMMKQRLSEANAAKETYISQYLSLCSTFLERLEDFAKVCRRKITAGQVEDLLQFIKSGKTLDEQRAAFYEIFDDTFIHIYPTFVADVNRLLQPDKQINVQAGNTLTTELRILAFQRLGIDDTARVARILGISHNTVYTYRNKLRSRAVNRDTFDEEVSLIGAIS